MSRHPHLRLQRWEGDGGGGSAQERGEDVSGLLGSGVSAHMLPIPAPLHSPLHSHRRERRPPRWPLSPSPRSVVAITHAEEQWPRTGDVVWFQLDMVAAQREVSYGADERGERYCRATAVEMRRRG